jgi:hypothetical protein
VLDLTIKEIVIAYGILRDRVDVSVARAWREVIAALTPDTTYTVRDTLRAGKRLNNYGIYACVGEWLRFTHGLADERAWIESVLELELPLFTPFGMYRDPGDPMLYDLSVRQNLSELLEYGYDGRFRDRIEELLRRAGLTTLPTLSPCGYAPFGGRSNALLHNEAMVSYICEFEAVRHGDRPDLASAFKEAAARAARATEPYARQVPTRFIKNLFDPSTRHGRDAGYGEYACYALLSASLFGRTALVADDRIPAAESPAVSQGCVLHLWPAFHKTFATCGDTHVEIDTRGQSGYDATGLGRFHRRGAPPELGLSMGLAENPKYIVPGAQTDRPVAIGPCWRTGAGEWQSLAGMGAQIEGVPLVKQSTSPQAVEWTLEWAFDSGSSLPITAVHQHYVLTEGHLEIEIAVQGVFDRLGLEIPCLVTAGGEEARIELSSQGLRVAHAGWVFQVRVQEASGSLLQESVRANRYARYRVARFDGPGSRLRASLLLCPSSS